MTSKKQYQAVAKMINDRVQEVRRKADNFADPHSIIECEVREEELTAVSVDLASIFQEDNPAFDRSRFLKACGVHHE